MQANAANEHSQMLAQVPANACSDAESRKCSLVLLLVPYITLATIVRVFIAETNSREKDYQTLAVRYRRERSINDDEQTRLFQQVRRREK